MDHRRNYLVTIDVRVRSAELIILFDRSPLLCAAALVRRSLRLRLGWGTAEYVPRRLRTGGQDPPVRSLRALLRKSLGFRRRELPVMKMMLKPSADRIATCRTRAEAERLLLSFGSRPVDG